ncbi:hypothetical protein [Pseudomonas sp. No.117]
MIELMSGIASAGNPAMANASVRKEKPSQAACLRGFVQQDSGI